MRARNIKPGYFTNEQLADCSDAAQILFAGLWCAADRDGLLEDRPRKLKAEIFPHKERDVDSLLNELSSASLILRYERDGQKCIFVPGFGDHQNPHPREKSSGLPKPKREQAKALEHEPDLGTAKQHLSESGPAESTSLLLNPESMNPESTSSSEPPKGGTEQEPATPDSPVVMTFPTHGKAKEWHLTSDKLAEYVESYPGVDVEQECRKARQWCRDNVSRQKTPGGMAAFLGNWLSKSQNGATSRPTSRAPPVRQVQSEAERLQRMSELLKAAEGRT